MLFKAKEQFRANTLHSSDPWIWRCSIALLGLFVIGQLLLAFDRSPSSDDALFLSVPKNWINGYGWATSYSEKIPFNPDFTGPTALLIPAALLIKWFGNPLWIAGVTGAIINLTLLALCLHQLSLYWKRPGLATLCLVCGCIISHPTDFASLIGYYSGSLLFFLTALIAFNGHYSFYKRALCIGVLAAVALHIKWLMAPAFLLLTLLFLLHTRCQKSVSIITVLKLLITILLPVVILHGSWVFYREYELSAYSAEYLSARQQYGLDFFRYHGSGIGQWQEANDKVSYLIKNTDKNLYFVEAALAQYGIRNPLLGNAPADEHHLMAWLLFTTLITATMVLFRKTRKEPLANTAWFTLTLTATILAYLIWFSTFSMAMSAGHFYFPVQWLLWLALLQLSQIKHLEMPAPTVAIALGVLISTAVLMPAQSRNEIFLQDRTHIPSGKPLYQATDFIQRHTFHAPLAGCGYGGYPRHLEYLLPSSQNFRDCLDLIEDHVDLVQNHYQWSRPLDFNIVISLHSIGFSTASSIVLEACKSNVLYKNSDVMIIQCDFSDLKKIDLDTLMTEIFSNRKWYKTRLSSKPSTRPTAHIPAQYQNVSLHQSE